MKIIDKYVIKEFIPQFILGFIVFTFILLMEKIFYLTNLIVSKGIAVSRVAELFLYISPSFCSFTFPMAFLMGTLLSLGRLQDDNEITALRAGGVPQFKIILPILIISIFTTFFLVYFNQFVVPNSQKKFTTIYYDIAYQQPTLKFEENTFFDLKEYKFFIKKIDRKTNILNDVIIYKTQEDYPLLITAKKGKIELNSGNLILILNDGILQQKDQKNPSKFTQMRFNEYTINFDMKEAETQMLDYSKSIVNLTATELKKEIKNLSAQKIDINGLEIQYYQRISIAIACFIFVFLGSSLAITSNKHTKSIAFGLSLILIFIFYILLAFGISLAEKKVLPVALSVNLPNIILGIVGLFLSFRVNSK
jgi:LPS export ABC transporter permease LptF